MLLSTAMPFTVTICIQNEPRALILEPAASNFDRKHIKILRGIRTVNSYDLILKNIEICRKDWQKGGIYVMLCIYERMSW